MSDEIEFEELRRQALSLPKEQRDQLIDDLYADGTTISVHGQLSRLICHRCRHAFPFDGSMERQCPECELEYSIERTFSSGKPCRLCGSTIHRLYHITWRIK